VPEEPAPRETGSSAVAGRAAGEDEKGMAAVAANVVDRLLDVGIDGRGPFDSARTVADNALSDQGDVERAIDAVVTRHTKLAAAGGFVTGLGGFLVLPVALPTNVLEFYAVATRMVGAIASLRGYDVRDQGTRSAVMLTLVGADADDLLRKAGVGRTGRLADLAAQRLPGPALMVLNKGIGFRLVSSVGKSVLGRFGRGVPVVGGVVGAGFDVYLLRRIAGHARAEFPARPVGMER
jgi:hypothetical protein